MQTGDVWEDSNPGSYHNFMQGVEQLNWSPAVNPKINNQTANLYYGKLTQQVTLKQPVVRAISEPADVVIPVGLGALAYLLFK